MHPYSNILRVNKEIIISIQHTTSFLCQVEHKININHTGFTEWIKQFEDKLAPWYCIEAYFAIYIFHGLNRLANINEFWTKSNSVTQFLFFNSAVSNTMSFSRVSIHRALHYEGFGTDEKKTDMNIIYKDVNKTIKDLWAPSDELSLDDDLFKWTGRGGLKKRIPGKADRVGNILWKTVDSHKCTPATR
ncbi:hypothetical protein DICPUDRAFT_77351 [Dictyostelium purpureum]|uniref:PiggyBac transposable element-derived protein domain-containing protein n=1 Tax=Dictyostelium purpureum TaxID=5786 RepID=F0ZGC6_DICPU|nr:uncharacterized protein DICPUDRAFT_77351 [Dictyostelium purpureum]EGC36971.1 hypothetical protein DICPUDRAFT_77351 [Dictyostelium purpureum]|eukprot:XP_003286468.1 hypothetical protein DICPUDRAFT_77351 [Dictyostelium purpureum]